MKLTNKELEKELRKELLLAVICEYNTINTRIEINKVESWLDKWLEKLDKNNKIEH